MKNRSRSLLILALILTLLSVGTPALAADSGRTNSNPGSALDDWDDDVWSDWGSQPLTKKGGGEGGYEEDNDLPKDGDMAGSGSLSASNSFGEAKDKVRFNLVRDGQSEPKGVRKYRPSYSRKSL